MKVVEQLSITIHRLSPYASARPENVATPQVWQQPLERAHEQAPTERSGDLCHADAPKPGVMRQKPGNAIISAKSRGDTSARS
jgi:hypothetical protein